MLDCVLIVVSYRSAQDVSELLETVPQAAGGYTWQAIIVNNDSADDLATVVATHPQAKLIEAGANLGYAGGINLALRTAPPSAWTLFLNPDLTLEPDAIATMIAAAGTEHPVVPLIRDAHGGLQRSLRREPTILGSLGDALLGDTWRGRPPVLSETVSTHSAYTRPDAVEWATGAALLMPTTLATEIGPWDERFFLYSEETDYCRRLREAGRQIRLVPNAVVTHRGGGSGSSDALHALLEVNRVRYFRKWHRWPTATVFATVAVLNNTLRCHRSRSRAAMAALLSPAARSRLPGGDR